MPAELKALRELQKQEEESSDEEQAGEASANIDTICQNYWGNTTREYQ